MAASDAKTDAAKAETDTERLEDQIAKLQTDVKAIAATLQKLTSEKLDEARQRADGTYEEAVRQGRHVLDDVAGQASEFEHSLKQNIRERPLTAVATALGIGYVLALLSRH